MGSSDQDWILQPATSSSIQVGSSTITQSSTNSTSPCIYHIFNTAFLSKEKLHLFSEATILPLQPCEEEDRFGKGTATILLGIRIPCWCGIKPRKTAIYSCWPPAHKTELVLLAEKKPLVQYILAHTSPFMERKESIQTRVTLTCFSGMEDIYPAFPVYSASLL